MKSIRIFLFGLLMAIAGCSGIQRADPNLYVVFGEKPGVQALVDDLLVRFADDELVAPTFANANIDRFRALFFEHLCELLDGPCRYSGDDMREVHRGLDIDETQFNAVVEHLIDAMDARGIPRTAQNRLIARMAPMRSDVIYQ